MSRTQRRAGPSVPQRSTVKPWARSWTVGVPLRLPSDFQGPAWMREEQDALNYSLGAKAVLDERARHLDTGRIQGVRARREASQEKLARLKTAVEELLKNGPKMTAEKIRDFMLDRKLSPYSPESTLKHVKTFISQIKKNR